MMGRLAAIVLAAGMGTRMRSAVPKVLHRINGLPMIVHVLNAVKGLRSDRVVIVVGSENGAAIKDAVRAIGTEPVIQRRPLGTANAVLSAWRVLRDFRGDLLIVNGDTPLITSKTLRGFLGRHRRSGNDLSIISFNAENPRGYGRIVRDHTGRACLIREEEEASFGERSLSEVNSGVYLLTSDAFPLLRYIKADNKKKEYYLTDILSIAFRRGLKCGVFPMGDELEFSGINTKEELLKVQRLMTERVVRYWLQRDVGFMDEERVYIHSTVSIGQGTYIYPNVCIEGATHIGRDCLIHPNVRITDSTIGDGVVVKDSSVIESSEVGDGARVGPFARLRPGTRVLSNASIGNFVEIKASVIGEGSKAQHLSYIGDAEVGTGVNIGAGTITCNYDGVKKHKTVIEDDVFIGSDSQIVAPVRVKRGAYVGAGSTITHDVPSGALAISRTKQSNIEGWALRKIKAKVKKKKGDG